MKLDLLKTKFLRSTGVSLDMLDEHPERIGKIFSFGKRKTEHLHPVSGRGYPYIETDGIDADEKDRENLEILKKW